MRRYVSPLLVLGLLILVAVVISWFVFPGWANTPGGILSLILAVIIIVVPFLNSLFSYLKNFGEISRQEIPNQGEGAFNYQGLGIEGVLTQQGQTNVIASDIRIDKSINAQINYAENISLYEANVRELLPPKPLKNLPPALPDYYVPRHNLLKKLRGFYGIGAPREHDKIVGVMLALCGFAGVGKTVLAQAFCGQEDVREFFSDGLIWASIGPDIVDESEADTILADWLYSYGIDPSRYLNAESKATALRSAIGEKRILIVLDDVWSASIVARLLQARGPNCRVLLTTRNREIPPRLGFSKIEYVTDLTENEARELVTNRLGTHPSDRLWRTQIRPVLRQLGGNALAVSLASAQVSLGNLSWKELIDIFSDTAGIEKMDFENASLREESIHLAISLSTRNLDEVHRRRFAWLGVLAKGSFFRLEDAAMIFPDINPPSAVDEDTTEQASLLIGDDLSETNITLKQFYDLGLIDVLVFPDSMPAFMLHPLAHEHSYRILEELGEVKQALIAHLSIYLRLVSMEDMHGTPKLETHFTRDQWTVALERAWKSLSQSPENALIDHAIASSFLDAMCPVLSNYWLLRGLYDDIIRWSERALSISIEKKDKNSEAIHLSNLGRAYHELGKLPEAQDFFDRALELVEKSKNKDLEGMILNFLGSLHLSQGKLEEAVTVFNSSLLFHRNMKDRSGEGIPLSSLGLTYLRQGDYDKAINALEEALRIAEEFGDRKAEAKRLANLGTSYLYRGLRDIQIATKFINKGLTAIALFGDVLSQARHLTSLGLANFHLGRRELALLYTERAIGLYESVNSHEVSVGRRQLEMLKGQAPATIEPLTFPELFMLTAFASMGDKIADARLRPVLESLGEERNEKSLLANRLLSVLNGERNISKLVAGLSDDLSLNIEVLVTKLAEPERGYQIDLLISLISALIQGDPRAMESAKLLTEQIHNQSRAEGVFSEQLVRCLRAIIEGNRDPVAVTSGIQDDLLKRLIRGLLEGGGLDTEFEALFLDRQ